MQPPLWASVSQVPFSSCPAPSSCLTAATARRQVPPADSTVVVDAETGFTFGQFITDNGIEYRIALPDPVPADTPYDVVLQVAAPHEIGWAGISWGGSMTYSPLTVAWPNDKDVTVSSRYAL